MIRSAFNKHKSIFIPFIMAGYPTLDDSAKAIMALAEAGADVIELGVPFSDPTADGPINQHAAQIAIQNGVNLNKIMEQIQEIRKLGVKTPIILFSYLNPILSFGYKKFCQTAKVAGVNGVLVVDLPPEEGKEFYAVARETDLEIVLLVSPTTDPTRLPIYKDLNPSFIYYISRLSVTGVQKDLSHSLKHEVLSLRKNLPKMKIAVGFGISSLEQAQSVSEMADGVIIGSKLVSTLNSSSLAEFKDFAKNLADTIHEGTA